MDATERRFVLLTQYLLDGVATEAEELELNQVSTSHPQLVTAVCDDLVIDALLKWQSGSIVAESQLQESSDTLGPSAPHHDIIKSPTLNWFKAAAILFIVAGILIWNLRGAGSVRSVIADIVDQREVIWSQDTTAITTDNAVHVGRLTSLGGEYTLQFRDGSTVSVVGPASFEVKSKMLVQFDHGRATAHVPQASSGFTVTSALVDVVDQGTEFGISVDEGGADIVVFDGKVDLKSNLGQPLAPMRLSQGQAVKVNKEGSFSRLVDIRRDVEGRWWSGDFSNFDGSLIARVSDNIWGGAEKYACYQTTSEGLQEDALAFSDNSNHQWNGISKEGIPEFLIGADYIRTFNDLRYKQELELTIELSRPAYLYVFSDNRIPSPHWLAEQFEDTGFDIGLDEGSWEKNVEEKYRKLDVNTTASGPGKSIDNSFSIWRRKCAGGEPITLGHAGELGSEGNQGRSMYGVAATPLEVETMSDQARN